MDGLLLPLGSPRKALAIISVCLLHKPTFNYRCKNHTAHQIKKLRGNAFDSDFYFVCISKLEVL